MSYLKLVRGLSSQLLSTRNGRLSQQICLLSLLSLLSQRFLGKRGLRRGTRHPFPRDKGRPSLREKRVKRGKSGNPATARIWPRPQPHPPCGISLLPWYWIDNRDWMRWRGAGEAKIVGFAGKTDKFRNPIWPRPAPRDGRDTNPWRAPAAAASEWHHRVCAQYPALQLLGRHSAS
jgi:hypothetical protein